MKDLATIQRIKNLRNHSNADTLEIATILGWQVVMKKGTFEENDLAVYVVIDTVLPEHPEFEFLRNKSFRIKPIRLRKEESAGIVFPISILAQFGYDLRGPLYEGMDVTEIIGVKKYEKPIPMELMGEIYGEIPGFLIVTDESNLRTYPDAIPELWGRPYYITRKDDGCSGTYFVHNGDFGVCSRRLNLKDTESNGFWRIARKYDIENSLRKFFPDKSIAIQGEVCGGKIQGNPLGLKELEFHAFSLFDILARRYLDYEDLVDFCKKSNIPMVTVIDEGSTFGYNIDELIKLATDQKYPNNEPAEGIVIRPKEGFYSDRLKKYWSGKIINPLYNEKEKIHELKFGV